MNEAQLRQLHGDLISRIGDPNGAEQMYHQAMAIARSQSAKLFELRAATSLAPLWWEQGKKSAARDLLKPAYGWFTEGLDTPILRSQGKQTVRGRLASLATCIRLDPLNPHLRVGLSHTDSGRYLCGEYAVAVSITRRSIGIPIIWYRIPGSWLLLGNVERREKSIEARCNHGP